MLRATFFKRRCSNILPQRAPIVANRLHCSNPVKINFIAATYKNPEDVQAGCVKKCLKGVTIHPVEC